MAYKSIFGGNSSVPTPSGLNPSGTGYRSVFQDAKADVSVPLNAGIETTYYKSVFDKPKTVEAQTVSDVTQKFLDSFVYSKGLKMDTPALPQQIARTDTQASPAPTTEAGYLLSSPGLKTEYFTPETAQNLKNLTSLTDPKKPVNLFDQMKDGLKGFIPGTAVTLPKMAGDAATFIGAAKTTAKKYIDKLEDLPGGQLVWNVAQSTKTGRFLDSFSGNFNERLAQTLGWDMNDDGTKKALEVINPGKLYLEVGTKLKEDADARMKAHPEWERPDYFHPDNTVDGVIANLQDQPVAYLTRVFSENAPQLGAQILLALTTGGVGSMAFMGSSAAGNTYQEAIDSGMPEEQALLVGTIRGTAEAALEKTGLDNLLAKGASRKIGDSFAKHLLKKIGEVTWKATVEGGTEFTQQVVANAIARTYDENRGFFDGAAASGLAGFVSGAPTAGVSAIVQGSGIDTNIDADTNVSNQNIIPQVNGGSRQPETVPTAPGSSQTGVNAPGVSATLEDLESPVADAPDTSVATPVQDLISGIAEAEVNALPTTGFGATQAQPTSRVTDLPRVDIVGANQEGQAFVLNAADLRRIQGEKFITDDGQNLIEAPTTEDALRVLDARTITDRDSNFVIKYQNTDLSAKELLEQVSPQGFDVVIDMLGRVAASQETLTNLQQLARFQDLKTKSELPTDLRDVIDRYASVRDLTLAGDMVARRLEAQGVDIPKTVAPDGISLGNVDPEQVLTRLAEIQNGAQVAPMRVKLTAEGITIPNAQDNVTAAALRQMGQEIPVKINPTDLLNQVVKQFGYDNLKEYFDVRDDVKAFRRGEKSLPSFSKEKSEAGARISPTQAERIVRRYFGKDEVTVQIAKKILTPAGERALGSYRGTIITFAENPLETTPTHEVLHAYFDMFTSPSRKEQVLREVMREYNVTDRIEAEEILADEFVEFVRGADSRNWTDIIRNFFNRVWEGIKTLANQQSAVYALYNDIIAKRRPEGVQVSNEILNNAQMFQVEGDVTLKVFSLPEFMKQKDMLVSEFLNVIKSSRAALKTNEQAFIEGVIKGYFPGKERISMLKLKNALLTESLQLRDISPGKTSYDSYGLNRIDLNGIETKSTVILNSPYNHGNTGHWSTEYENEQKKLYKTIPLGEQFGIVEAWVDPSIENQDIKTYFVGTEEQAKGWLTEHKDDKEPINKGLFAHYRVWRTEGYKLPYAERIRGLLITIPSQIGFLDGGTSSFYARQAMFDPNAYPNSAVLYQGFEDLKTDEEFNAFIPKYLKALTDESGRELAYEKLEKAVKFLEKKENFVEVARNNMLSFERDPAFEQRLFDAGTEYPSLHSGWSLPILIAEKLSDGEVDTRALAYVIEGAFAYTRATNEDIAKGNDTTLQLHMQNFLESANKILVQQKPSADKKASYKKIHDTLKETSEKYWNERNETSPYEAFVAEIQGDSFQQEKYKNTMDRDSATAETERAIRNLEEGVKSQESFLAVAKDLSKVVLPERTEANKLGIVSFSEEAMSKMKLTPASKKKIANVFDAGEFVGVSQQDIAKLFTIKGVFPDWWTKANAVFLKHGLTLSEYSPNERTINLRESLLYRFDLEEAKNGLQKMKDKLAEAKENLKLLDGKVVPMTAAIEKNFAAFQDTWHELTTKRVIQDEARKGAEAIYFPGLSTIAKIEGFTNGDIRKQLDKPTERTDPDFDISGAVVGETVEYGGRSWTVLEEGYDSITMGLSTNVELYDERRIEEMFNGEVEGRFDEGHYELKRLEKVFGDSLYDPEVAAEIIKGYEELSNYDNNIRYQRNVADARFELARLEKIAEAINDPEINSIGYSVAELAERQTFVQNNIDTNIEALAKEGLTETSVIKVPKAFETVGVEDISHYLDYSVEDILTSIADGTITDSDQAENKLRDDAAESVGYHWSFEERARDMGWTVYEKTTGRNVEYLVVEDESSAEVRRFSEEDFTTEIEAPTDEMREQMEKDAEELTEEAFFKKYYKEIFKMPDSEKDKAPEDRDDPNKPKRGVIYFYEAKVISYLNKLRKGNLELVQVDGDWWYKTKVTPEDTGPVTMFQVDKTADQIVAENIVKSTATTKQAINQAIKGTKPEAVLKTEAQLLKDSLRAQRRVARSIVKNTQQRLAEQFANKLADIRKVKTYLTEYLKMLPLNERGKMITLVRDAETIFDLAKATNRVNVKMEEVEKREVIAEIRKAYNRILESPGVDVAFKAQVSGLFNEIQIQGKSNATMERLAKLREFIQARTEKGEPVYIQSRLLRQLEILDKTPIKEIPVERLEVMLSDMELLEDQGRLKKELRYQAYRRQVESIAESVMPELIPIDRPEYIKKVSGEDLTKEERLTNAATTIKRTKLALGKAIRTMDVFFDMFSGGKGLYNTQFFTQFKGRIDGSFQGYLQEKDRLIQPINDLARSLQLTEAELERIGTYAQLKQEGGLDKLIQLGLKQADLEQIQLTEREMKFYDAMREKFAETYPHLKEYMARVFNKDIGSVENYFPMVTNWDEMSEVDMLQRFGTTEVDGESLSPELSGRPKKNVIAGSTIERKRGAQQKIITNALVAYKRHMDNAIYMLEMGETIRTLGDVIKIKDFKKSIGDYGYQILLEYIDLLARKGGKQDDPSIRRLDMLRKNSSIGVMGLKLSSILVQPSAFGNGAADIGTEYALKGAAHLALDPDWREFAIENMPELKARVGNDPAFAEIDEISRYQKFKNFSMDGLKFFDAKTAATIAMGAYEKYMDDHGLEIDLGNPNKDALAYAQLKLRKTQGSNFFKDQPLMYSRGALTESRSIDRTLGAFQSFMVNNWNWLSYDFPERIKRDPKQAVEAATWLLMAQLYTVTAQALSKDILAAIFGGEGEEDPFMKRLAFSFFNNIPFVSQIFSTIEYGSTPVPLISTTNKIGDATKTIFGEGKPTTKAKAAVRAASGVGTLMGIPGSTQAGDVVTRLMTGDK